MHSRSRALLARRASRRLAVTETVSLGEKRFVSILCVDGEQFLVGGSSSNVVLLAKLEKSPDVRSSATTVSETFSGLISRVGGEATGRISPRLDDEAAGL
ncbi:MAG TPA: flagellar biosynthetic protein FliO [Acidobacteriaceae bacterium]|nr:flagellar biosynthetic protein FliO [Acidobacteriaceae bacterium]